MTKPDRILRLMLVDDHALVRGGYSRLLALEPDLVVVAEHGHADAAYAALVARPDAVDVLVLDLSLPGRSGLDLLRRLRQRLPRLRTLVCTMHDSPGMVAQALDAGAAGLVTKSSDPALLANAIRQVAAGERILSPDVAGPGAADAARRPHEVLSTREFEVLLLLARGRTLQQIAEGLHIAPKTVSNLQTRIRSRLGVNTAVELLRYVHSHRLGAD